MRILLVDDEPDLLEVASTIFTLHWGQSEILCASDGEEGLKRFFDDEPDLMILDVSMPRLSGLDVLRRVRQVSTIPIILLTVKGDELDKVRGLELGADDYITKPFGHLELLARVRAVLRRAEMVAPVDRAATFRCEEFCLNYADREVTLRNHLVELTPTEYNLLSVLAHNAGRVLTHETLLKHVWGEPYAGEIDYLKVYIRRLRSKIEPNPANPYYILTERGLGYKFRRPAH
ncbi:MAG TPA: response regulator transcription factor [Ktedonobacterales bacterium]|nr:response regulator transcription factor [Ktedonobacterales bacterium]